MAIGVLDLGHVSPTFGHTGKGEGVRVGNQLTGI